MTPTDNAQSNDSQVREHKPAGKNGKAVILAGGAGLVAGIVLAGLLMFLIMPGMMIVQEESKLGFQETVAAIEQAIEAQGWVHFQTVDMNASLAKHGVDFKPQVRLIKFCNAEYASDVLSTDPYVSCLMPCTIAVWEDGQGQVMISKMNTGLMGKMFGGNVAKVMGGSVGRDEKEILRAVQAD